MSAWKVIGGLQTLINQVESKHPRMTVGTIGNEAHKEEISDHNPDANGNVCAADFMIGDWFAPADCVSLVSDLITAKDTRLHYVIYNRRIYRDAAGFKSEAYTGTDPHTNHVHVSVYHNANSTTEWDIQMPLSDADVDKVAAAVVKALTTPVKYTDDLGGSASPVGEAVLNTYVPRADGKRHVLWGVVKDLDARTTPATPES